MKHISASQIKTYRDCARKWYYERTDNAERTVTAAIDRGKRIHTVLENALLSGSCEGFAAEPLLEKVEWIRDLVGRGPWDRACIEREVRIEEFALPIIGYIDFVYEEAGTVYIYDHKTTSDWKYALTAEDLATDPQALIYCYDMLRAYPDAHTFVFAHHVINTRKAQQERMCDVTFTRGQVEAFGPILAAELAAMQATFGIGIANSIEGAYNDACHKYGGCVFRERCGVPKRPSWAKTEEFVPMFSTPTAAPTAMRIVYRDCLPMQGAQPMPWASFVLPVVEDYCRVKKCASHLVVPYQEGVREVALGVQRGVEAGTLQWPAEGVFVDSGDPCAALFCTLLGAGWQVVRPVR